MNSKKIVSVVMILVMLVSVSAVMTSCGSSSKEPKTLEDYFKDDEDAKQELDDIASNMSGDNATGTITVKENMITITVKFNETYESDYLDAMKKVFDAALDEKKTEFQDQIETIEEKSGIEGVSMLVTAENGDGTELVNKTYTAE